MNKEHLTYLQIATLCFFLTNSFIINIGYNYLSNINYTDAIFDIIIGGIIVLLFFYIISLIKNNNRNKNLIDIINESKILKYILTPIIIFILILSIVYSLELITSFIHYYILKEVNKLIITITFIATILYLVKQGISTITKVSEICFYVYLLFFIISLIGLITDIDLNNLKPLFTTNINNHINTSSIYFLSTVIPLFNILIIKEDKIKSVTKENKLPFIFIILSILLTFFQYILIISILGIQLTNIYQNPDMIIYKKISFLNILDRVEVILAFNNILNIFFTLTLYLYTLKKMITKTIKTKKEHIILALLGISIFILSNTLNINTNLYLFLSSLCLIIFIIITLKSFIHKYNHH